MGRYRKIDSRIWNDEKFSKLTDRGKLAFLFILTHPGMTALGAMRASLPGLAAELGWSEKAFREAFREAFANGMLKANEKACYIGVPNFLRYNPPESPNCVRAWASASDLIPECAEKTKMLEQVKGFAEGLHEGYRKAFSEAFAKASPIPEPEPEPEPEPDKNPTEGESATKESFEKFWQAYPKRPSGKGSKQDALKAWIKMTDDERSEAMRTVPLFAACQQWTKDGGEFIPQINTWMNQKRWQSPPPDNGKPNPKPPKIKTPCSDCHGSGLERAGLACSKCRGVGYLLTEVAP